MTANKKHTIGCPHCGSTTAQIIYIQTESWVHAQTMPGAPVWREEGEFLRITHRPKTGHCEDCRGRVALSDPQPSKEHSNDR